MEESNPTAESAKPQVSERTLALVLNRDLLFGARIRQALNSLGLTGRFVRDAEALAEALDGHSTEAAIVIIDMNQATDWDLIARALREASAPPPTLAFGPHVDADGRRAAKRSAIDRIVSNGQFHREMVALIERYRRR
jgi:hypothetical protein